MELAKPLIIAVAGNSGSGKSKFVELLTTILGKKNTLIIHGDDYHKWARGAPEWDKFTHLNPKANNLHLASKHISLLKKGKTIKKNFYDHSKGTFTSLRKVPPKKFIIFEGLHSLFTKEIRANVDFKIFIDVSQKLNTHFKLHRDMSERGHSKEKILKSIELRKKDYKKFILTQKKFADLIIRKTPLIPLNENKKDTAVKYSFILSKKIDLSPIANIFKTICPKKISIKKNNKNQSITTKNILEQKELNLLKKFTKETFGIKIENNIMSLSQLIVAYNLSHYGCQICKLHIK